LPLLLQKLLCIAKRRPSLGLAVLSLLFAVQISPWLYPSVDGCLYLKTVNDFRSTPRLDDFCCLVPPAFPVLIAPAFLFGDRPFLAVSILNWLLAVALIGGVYVWARRILPSAAMVLTTVLAVNISLWTFYRRPTKEVATLAFLVWTINAMHGLLDERRTSRIVWLTVAVSLLTSYLVLIRYAAIMLAVAFTMAAAWHVRKGALRPRRAIAMSAVICLVSGSVLGTWLVYDRWHGTGGRYVDSIVSIYRRPSAAEAPTADTVDQEADERAPARRRDRHFARALLYRVDDLACLTIPGMWKASSASGDTLIAVTILGALLFGVLGLGWWKLFSTRIDVFALLLPIYLLLYAHWDCPQPGGRFLLPMLPIILACLGAGTWAIFQYTTPTGARRWQVALLTGCILAHFGQATAYWLLYDLPRARECQRNLPMVDRLADRIQKRSGLVAIAPSLEQRCNGLWLDLDWKRMRILEKPLRRRVEWIVDLAGAAPVTGFAVECVDGPVQLLRRELVVPAIRERIGQQSSADAERL
jgi:hypothetical protein